MNIKELLNFIDETANAYCCIKNIKQILISNGYKELYESEKWSNLEINGKYFTIRNDSSLIAFKMCHNKSNFNLIVTHPDSPTYTIKTNPEIFENNYLKLNISGYGGMINYSFLDRPLSIAGRVVIVKDSIYKSHIIDIKKDLLVIPSQAIHINSKVNTECKLNIQDDMLPIISLTETKLIDILSNALKELNIEFDKIYDYDLTLYNRDSAKIIGLNDEFILSPRLDNLVGVFTSLNSFINANNLNCHNFFCTLNNEEIGSESFQGADSTFLIDVLSRIATSYNIDLSSTLSNSILASVDNTHAIHPNAPLKNDPTNKVYLNKGIVIEHDTNLTTDAITSSLFKGLLESINIPYQDYVSRADIDSGGTLGTINQKHVGIDSLDIGLSQLAMHSANELMGTNDILYLYKALLKFYEVSFVKENNTYKILES